MKKGKASPRLWSHRLESSLSALNKCQSPKLSGPAPPKHTSEPPKG